MRHKNAPCHRYCWALTCPAHCSCTTMTACSAHAQFIAGDKALCIRRPRLSPLLDPHNSLCGMCVKPSPCERKSITIRVECVVHVWISFAPLSSYFLIVTVLFVSILTRIHDLCSYRLEQHASGDDTEFNFNKYLHSNVFVRYT
jgi:hypothetical protein